MTQRTFRRALGAVLVCVALPAVTPAAASASTFTVDDDKAQCSNAAFSSIQAAVDQAAPWDTIIVCDGTYEEQSTPTSGNGSPSQTGSLNGLTITKPLTIKGAGAGKVTIKPVSSLATLAGTAPYLRDAGGNVVTVTRQARDATDMNTMFVDISGVTVTSGTTYAEAGIAFFNASGAVRNSVVGPLLRAVDGTELAARPHGWGIVMTNHLQGAEAGPHRELTVENSRVFGYQSGGILFDDARGIDGAATTTQRSGIVSYGIVRGTRVEGSGPDATIPQTGVQYNAGQRGQVSGSTITGNYFTPDTRRSAGILLTDAETGADPSNPTVRALYAYNNILTQNGYGLFNANATNDAVRTGAPVAATPGVLGLENYWGCSAGPVVGGPSANDTATGCQGVSGADGAAAASVELGLTRTSPQIFAAAPGATLDAAPTASFGEPLDGAVTAGAAVDPVVIARDDFGVRAVSLTLDGDPLADKTTGPYEFTGAWTPGFDEIGETHTLGATVVDSAGVATSTSVEVTVLAPTGYLAADVDSDTVAAGSVTVGSTADRTITVANTGENPITLSSIDVAGSGFSAAGGTCTAAVEIPVAAICTVTVRFAPTVAGAATGTLTLPYTAIGGGAPLVVALSGAGVAPETREPETREPETREPETRTPETRAPEVTAPVATIAVNSAAPSIAGTATVGATLTCTPGSWSGAPAGYGYQWLRDGAPISGATAATYKVTQSDLAALLSCRVIAANAAGASAAAESPAVGVTFATVTTKTTVAKQAGAAVVTFTKTPKAAKGGTLAFAKVLYVGTGTGTIRTTGTLKVGAARFAVRLTRRTAAGKSSTLSVKLSPKARKALKKKAGTLTLKVATGGSASGTATLTITVKRG